MPANSLELIRNLCRNFAAFSAAIQTPSKCLVMLPILHTENQSFAGAANSFLLHEKPGPLWPILFTRKLKGHIDIALEDVHWQRFTFLGPGEINAPRRNAD